MPLLGFLLASSFASYIQKFDHWIACVLLVFIGANMLREAFSKEEEQGNDSFAFRVMLPLAVATSIDALATGVTFAMMGVNIWIAIAITGLTTFVFSVAGCQDRQPVRQPLSVQGGAGRRPDPDRHGHQDPR